MNHECAECPRCKTAFVADFGFDVDADDEPSAVCPTCHLAFDPYSEPGLGKTASDEIEVDSPLDLPDSEG